MSGDDSYSQGQQAEFQSAVSRGQIDPMSIQFDASGQPVLPTTQPQPTQSIPDGFMANPETGNLHPIGNAGQPQSQVNAQDLLANLARSQQEYFKQNFAPVEKDYLDEISQLDSPNQMAIERGMGVSTVQQAMPTVVAGNPHNGNLIDELADMAITRGSAAANAETGAVQRVKDRKVTGLQKAVSLGRGLAGEGLSGASRTAAMEQQSDQAQAIANRNRKEGNQYAAGAVVGGATSAYLNRGYQAPDFAEHWPAQF